MTTDIEKTSPRQQTVATLTGEGFRAELKANLPTGLSVDRFVAVARSAIMQDDKLAACDQVSLFQAFKKCAQDGLMPDGREAAMVRYMDRRAGVEKAQYIPMIGGLRKIAAEYGVSIAAYTVHEHDVFDYVLGLEPLLRHVPAPLGTDRGALIGAYAVGTDREGRKYVEVLGKPELDKVRKSSKTSDRGPWVDWYEAMCCKTAARKVFKQIPLLMEKARGAIEASDAEYELDTRPALMAPAMTVSADAAFEVSPVGKPGDGADAAPGIEGSAAITADGEEGNNRDGGGVEPLDTGSPATPSAREYEQIAGEVVDDDRSIFSEMAAKATTTRKQS